jgi:AraC-like DNA-binding protein
MNSDLLSRLDSARDLLAAEPVALAVAAREACLSPFHFHREFVRAFGQTPHDFATGRRFEEARKLLLFSDLPVTEVCLEVGYESLGTFSARFRREFGLAPNDFREGGRRYWAMGGIRSHRFIPTCFFRNRKIEEVFSPL